MEMYTVGIEQMTTNANCIKDALLEALEKEGFLNKPAKEIGGQYVVVLHKKGWLGRLFNFGKEEQNAIQATVVKVV